jgi:hypothetical protein
MEVGAVVGSKDMLRFVFEAGCRGDTKTGIGGKLPGLVAVGADDRCVVAVSTGPTDGIKDNGNEGTGGSISVLSSAVGVKTAGACVLEADGGRVGIA